MLMGGVSDETGSCQKKGGLTMSRERRRLFLEEEQTAEPGRYGCPMLVRAH